MKNFVVKYPNGQIYCNGSAVLREYFYEEGTLKTVEPYQDGRFHGEVLLYWPNGQLKRRVVFAHGVRQEESLV